MRYQFSLLALSISPQAKGGSAARAVAAPRRWWLHRALVLLSCHKKNEEKSSQRGSLRLTSDKAERLRAFREGPADDGRRPRQEPAHVVSRGRRPPRPSACDAPARRNLPNRSRRLHCGSRKKRSRRKRSWLLIMKPKARREAERKEERRRKKERDLFEPDSKGETALHRAVLAGDATELTAATGPAFL